MTDRIQRMLDFYIKDKAHHQYRQPEGDKYRYAVRYKEMGLDDLDRSVYRLGDVLAEEKPVVFPDEKIIMMRTVVTLPEIFTEEEFKEIGSRHYIHEQGKLCNICPNYMNLLECGLTEKKAELDRLGLEFEKAGKPEEAQYEHALCATLEMIQNFMERYADEADRAGNHEAAFVLHKVTRDAPQTLQEALQLLRVIHYCLWCSFNYHNGLGRFDQYMYPYYKNDIESGRLTRETALELIEEFFISLNKDSDLYTGMQQGDNGQSMMLGGLNKDGSESFNDLSDLCLQASLELKLIDPKINLRVNKNTPLSEYIRGTELTRVGIGFPQYSNDDVVLKALRRWGYDEEDIYNYTVAACWEFIIPGYGTDIVNVNGMSFPKCAVASINKLEQFDSFDELMEDVKSEIYKESDRLRDTAKNVYMEPAPLMSLLMNGCVENGRDASKGCKYNNYGFHGTGIATAVDSLASIRKYVFEDKTVSKGDMLDALRNDFEGRDELVNELRYEGPKFGNDDDRTDDIAVKLLDWFADALEGHKNDMGGIYRAGTGSAMYYIWQSENEQATPDGRRKGEQFAANYSPSIFTRLDGPFSIIKSFAKPNLERVANGGPLTIELSDTMFRNEEAIEKTAAFVKTFIDLGGHQMQINAVNLETLRDAKLHPENHKNLIVRVWGWSGYFVELDECYQNQIMKRMELVV
ncbi:MAG: pyruvate formate lyase family protein [Lachnospiraceae bacterium]|nr:pyruvate formate lyase family protein [Lachnospiraceae bacterium]